MADIDIKIKLEAARAQAQLAKFNAQVTKSDQAARKARLQADKLEKEIDQIGKASKGASVAFASLTGVIAGVGLIGAVRGLASVTKSLVGAGLQVGQVAGEIEDVTVQFEVLTGSVQQADKAVRDLQEFAANTPFQFRDLAKAEQRLLSFGFSLENAQDLLGELGDVAAASNADIGELSLIFGQVAAAGKLTGERLLQFQERAIPIGPALAKTLGVAESSIRDLVSQGKVDFATFEEAFRSLNDTGEFAFEGMIKRSQTLGGRLSTLRDNFERLQANLGKALLPTFKAILTTATQLIQGFSNTTAVDAFSDKIGVLLPKIILGTINTFRSFIDVIGFVVQSFRVAIGAVAAFVTSAITVPRVLAEVNSAVLRFLGLSNTAIGRTVESFRKATASIQNTAKSIAANTFDATSDIADITESVAATVEKTEKLLAENFAKEAAAAKASADAVVESQDRKIQKTNELAEKDTAAVDKRIQEEQRLIETLNKLREDNRLLEEEVRVTQTEIDGAFFDANIEEFQSFLTDKQQREFTAKVQSVTTETERQIEIQKIEKTARQQRLKSEKDFSQQQLNLEMQTSRQKANILRGFFNLAGTIAKNGSKEQFVIQQASALASAIVSTQQAAAQALAVPPAPNFGLAALAKGAGALNVATIAAQTIKGFENGGIVGGTSFTGDQVQARVNSGEMILNREQQTQLFNLANGSAGSSSQQEIVVHTTVELDGEAVGQSVSRQVANGLQLGEVQ